MLADAAHFERRASALLSAFDAASPEAVITELYPFGRRALAAEFDDLLAHANAAHPRPAILASIRDVLNPSSKPERASETLDKLQRRYDAVLFHGDDEIVPLSASWPLANEISKRLRKTGYVADSARVTPIDGSDGLDEIIVSGGGSAAGLPLARAAIEAAPPSEAEQLIEALRALHPDEMSPRDALEALYALRAKLPKQ